MELGWCATCGGRHARPVDCPGDLVATGVERHGWRVVVDTPNGPEAYGVLVAPAAEIWRARILTFPNILWTAPGGKTTMKFVGATPQEAEGRAIEFVETHIATRGLVRRDTPDVPAVATYQAETLLAVRAVKGPPVRKVRAVPARFGNGPALFTAMTANLSESGLFLVTLAPFDPGTGLRVHVSLDTGALGLNGQVVWKRDRPAPGRPVGMGVKLIAPPAPYQRFVWELP